MSDEKENMTERPVPTSAEHSMCRSVADLVQCLLFLSSSRSNAPSLHLTSSSLVQVESGKREVWGFSIPRAILNTLHHLDQLDLYPATCIPSDPKNKPKTLLSGSIFWAPSLRESTNIDSINKIGSRMGEGAPHGYQCVGGVGGVGGEIGNKLGI
jgi:hypothetical protein